MLRTVLRVWAISWLAMGGAAADTVSAASPSRTDVLDAINASSNGDTVLVPAGSAGWSGQISIGKAITLQGAGVGSTIIRNQSDGFIFSVSCTSAGRIRITGFELQGEGSDGTWGMTFSGDKWAEYQVDNCKFEFFGERAIRNEGLLQGLIYDCSFVNCFKTVDVYGGNYMNESWQEALTLGTTRACVVEDCSFFYDSQFSASQGATSSRGQGGRSVWRFNTWKNTKPGLDFFPILDCHGNQARVSGQNPTVDPPGGTGTHRGTRQFEAYGNTFHSDAGGGANMRLTDLRGGTIIMFENVFTGGDMQDGFKAREEDGPNNRGFLSGFPGYDSHWMWFWDNLSNGQPITTVDFTYNHDPNFLIEGTNYFFRSPRAGDPIVQSYTPLAYPHPWRQVLPPPKSPRGFREP